MKESDPPPGPSPCPTCGAPRPAPDADCPACAETRMPEQGPGAGGDTPALRTIAGFDIVREVGAGGMGTVYEAIDRKLNRRVALKILARHLSPSEKAGARFAREAWIGGKLTHPNLVKVYDKGEWEDLLYISMEYVDGGSLQEVIRRMDSGGEDPERRLRFGSREYVNWAIDQVVAAARGLDYAHRQGVVHRDIKPMNLLLSRDPDMIKIADFGLAVGNDGTRLTTGGKVFGTLAYMPPEQVRGDTDTIDPRTDIYALGVTLFELLTLQLPFSGKTQELYIDAVLTQEPKRITRLNNRVGRDLETVLGKALEKNPRDRYESASAFADDLDNVLKFRPIGARPPSPIARLGKWVRRKPIHAALVAALVIGVPIIAGLTVRGVRQQRTLRGVEIERLRRQADTLNHDRRYREALAPLTAILGRDPDNRDALVDRALVHTQLGKNESAAAALADRRDAALADIERVVGIYPDNAWPLRMRAYIHGTFGDETAADRDNEAADAIRSEPLQDYDLLMEGRLAFLDDDFATARDRFAELSLRRPDFARARQLRAQALEELGDFDAARTEYEVVAALEPNNVIPAHSLARLRILEGAFAAAEAQFLRAASIDPDNPFVYEGLSHARNELGIDQAIEGDLEAAAETFERAEEAARRALALDPDLPAAHLNLGVSLMERYRLQESPDPALVDQAIAEYDDAIDRARQAGDDSDPGLIVDALVNQCDALIQAGRLERALPACGQSAERQPDDPVAFYNLAGVHALAGRADDAIAALETDLALGDTDWEYLETDDWFAALRDDPRFLSVLERMKAAAAAE